jgi:hypothetical protein
MRFSLLAAGLTLAVVASTAQAQPLTNPSCTALGAANLVRNCSFEAPGVGSGKWQWTNDITSWTSSSGYFERWYGHDGFTSRDGSAHLELDVDTDANVGGVMNTTVWQVLNTQAGRTYNVFFSSAHRPKGGQAQAYSQMLALLDFNGGTGLGFTAFTTPQLFDSNDNNLKWKDHGFSFTATGSQTTLGFRAAGTANEYGDHLDNIGVTAVPEPNAVLLVASGLLGLGVVARRRRA